MVMMKTITKHHHYTNNAWNSRQQSRVSVMLMSIKNVQKEVHSSYSEHFQKFTRILKIDFYQDFFI